MVCMYYDVDMGKAVGVSPGAMAHIRGTHALVENGTGTQIVATVFVWTDPFIGRVIENT